MSWARQGRIYRKIDRTSGKVRKQCSGQGMRSALALEPQRKRMRKEGEEEGEREEPLIAVTKLRQSALSDVFKKIEITFERWRRSGQ